MADPAAKIIFGTYNDRVLKPGQIKVTVIATGFANSGISRMSEVVNATTLFAPSTTVQKELKTDLILHSLFYFHKNHILIIYLKPQHHINYIHIELCIYIVDF